MMPAQTKRRKRASNPPTSRKEERTFPLDETVFLSFSSSAWRRYKMMKERNVSSWKLSWNSFSFSVTFSFMSCRTIKWKRRQRKKKKNLTTSRKRHHNLPFFSWGSSRARESRKEKGRIVMTENLKKKRPGLQDQEMPFLFFMNSLSMAFPSRSYFLFILVGSAQIRMKKIVDRDPKKFCNRKEGNVKSMGPSRPHNHGPFPFPFLFLLLWALPVLKRRMKTVCPEDTNLEGWTVFSFFLTYRKNPACDLEREVSFS